MDRAEAYLWDARDSGRRILRFIAETGHDAYLADELLKSAVERQFEIIGEAFAQLRRLDPDRAAAIPELPDAVAFRNLLIHGYAQIDHERVWQTVETSLPALLARLDTLLD